MDQVLNLRVGEIVEVRSEAEILATLDARAELESLPFMPEMLQFCGRRFRVDKLALKLCDTIGSTGMYRMHNAVHLEGLRCDGQAHGGCQAGCLIYWKEAWLKRAPADGHDGADTAPEPATPRYTRATLLAATRKGGAAPDDERFSCQATELLRAAPERIPAWDGRQYLQDVRSGNASLLATIRAIAIGMFNEYQDFSRRFVPKPLRIRGGMRLPFIAGRLEKTPEGTLDLQPGEPVRIKSKQEIVSTLDVNNSNRGLSFDPEMLWYCGLEARVLRRVERLIDERTGELLRLKRPCIVLEGVTCRGDVPPVLPARRLPVLAGDLARAGGMTPLLGPLRDLRTLVRFVRERGVGHAGRLCALAVRGRWMAAADRRREARFGVSSEGSIALRELAIDSENRSLGFRYVPSPGLLVDTLLFNIGEDLGRFSFVDFGSGKGRVLLVASHYPFGEVVGVEFSTALHEIAEDNIRKYQSPARRCQNVRSVCADAATFALPEHDCVLYFNNPFAEPVFARVLGNVQAAHERSHRQAPCPVPAACRRARDRPHAQPRDAGALGVPSRAASPLRLTPLTLPTGFLRATDVRIRRSALGVAVHAAQPAHHRARSVAHTKPFDTGRQRGVITEQSSQSQCPGACL